VAAVLGGGRRTRAGTGTLLALAIVLASAAPAQGYRHLPARWGKRTLVYANTAATYRAEVAAAVRAWNRSGVRFRWKAGPRRRADVVIRITRNLPVAGLATSSYAGGRFLSPAKIELRADLRRYGASPPEQRFTATAVIAHEMGHVMGLDHDNRRCATMNIPHQAACARPEQPWRYRCRVVERDDVRGAVRLYGGRPRASGPATCDAVAAPGRPGELSVAAGAFGEARVSWRMPAGGVQGVRVLRGTDSCPTGAADDTAEVVHEGPAAAGTRQEIADHPPAPGRYCYAVVALAALQRPGPAAAVAYEFAGSTGGGSRPPVAAFDYYEDDPADPRLIQFDNRSSDDGAVVSGRWDFGDGTTATEPNPAHLYAEGGTYTVTLTVTDDEGNTDSVAVTIQVAEPPPPG
jgi:hypothetical protein